MRSTAVAVVRAGFDGVWAQQQNGLEEGKRVQVVVVVVVEAWRLELTRRSP